MQPFTYILPIRSEAPPSAELSEYIRRISMLCRVVIVDGSSAAIFARAHDEWAPHARHIRPDPHLACANGKVHGVLTGLRDVTTDLAVIADDDVRYTAESLQEVIAALATADLVMPQNFFRALPWHARWDTARTLINRMTGGDFAGTVGLRVGVLGPTRAYDGNVLFENLELMRTVEAAGGVVRRADDIYVLRLPPTTHHFFCQRVRQAYDELARPARFATWLAVLPAIVVAGNLRRLAAGAAFAVAIAEAGRRRCGGPRHFPWSSSLLAPAWVLERAVTVWLAVVARLRGGVPYSGRRLRRATSPRPWIRTRPAVLRSAAGAAAPAADDRRAA